MWTIFSIGDSAFLEQVLNGVAMVTATSEFTDMIKVALLLGVIIIFMQSLWNGGKGIDWGQAFVAFLVFNLAFVPKVDVAIEDVYDDSVRVVANVPIGVAAAGSIISTTGYEVARLFETAFSTPAMTDYGFASPLQTLAGVRKMDVLSSDLMKSWVNYFKECTLIGVDMGAKNLNDIMKTEPFIEQLRFDSPIYGTEIYVPTKAYYNCTDAYDALLTETGNSDTFLYAAIAPHVGATDAADSQVKVEEAMNHLGGAMAGSAQQWMYTTALIPAYNAAVQGKYIDDMAYTHAVMANQAIAQRNTQWAADATLFASIVRPLMTFLEGFTYAITPIMAFVLAVAPIGGKMAGKYLLTLVWISLWQPVMAVTNLYLLMAAGRKMQALAAHVADPTSYEGLMAINREVQNWLATGGTLAAATPALSLMLVYGSAMTATHLAGRLGGSDHIDEKMATPDIAKSAGGMQVSAGFQQTAQGGFSGMQQEQLLGQMSFGSQLSNAVSSAQTNMQTAQQSLSAGFGSALKDSFSKEGAVSALSSFGSHVASTNSSLFNAAKSQMESMGYTYKQGDQQSEAVLGMVAAKMSGTASAGLDILGTGAKVSGEISGASQTSSKKEATTAIEDAFNKMKNVNTSSQTQAAYQDELAKSFAQNSSSSFVKKLGGERTQSLSKDLTDTAAATRQFSSVSALQNAFGHSTGQELNTMANRIANDGGQYGNLLSYAQSNHDLNRAINGENGSGGTLAIAKSAGLVGNKAHAAAALLAMARSGDFNHLSKMAEMAGVGPQSDPNAASGMQVPQYGDAGGVHAAGIDGLNPLEKRVNDGQAAGNAAINNGNLDGHGAQGRGAVSANSNAALAAAHREAYKKMTPELLNYSPDRELAGLIESAKEKAGYALGSIRDNIMNGGPIAEQFTADKAAREAELYDQARSDHHLTDAQAKLYAAMAVSGGHMDSGRWEGLAQGVRDEFKYIDDRGDVRWLENGQALAEKQIELVSEAGLLGEKNAGSALAKVSGFNEATGRTDVKGIPVDSMSHAQGWR